MTTRTPNTVLVRYARGHAWLSRGGVGGIREAYLELPGVTREDEALGEAGRFLDSLIGNRTTVAVSGPVLEPSQAPSGGYSLYDHMGTDRIQSLTISTDGEGPTIVLPELADPLSLAELAQERRLQRVANGTTPEFGAPGINRQPEGNGIPTTPPPFSLSGLATEATELSSPPWRCPGAFALGWIEVQAVAAGVTQTRAEFKINGTTVTSAYLPAGLLHYVHAFDAQIAIRDVVTLVVTEAGAGASDITYTMRGATVAMSS